jgi:hypothetical protein
MSHVRYAERRPLAFMCFGNRRLPIHAVGIIETCAGEGLSEEDAVFTCRGGQWGHATKAATPGEF